MEFTHVEKEAPFIREFKLFGGQDDFIKEIINTGRVEVTISYNSKTSLYISLSINGKFSFHLPFSNPKFKFLTTESYSYFTNESTTKNYFKLSKYQGYYELKEYIVDCLHHMLEKFEGMGIVIKVEWIKSKEYLEIKERYVK